MVQKDKENVLQKIVFIIVTVHYINLISQIIE